MLVFLWNAVDERLAERTEQCISSCWSESLWGECRFVRLSADPAATLNRELAAYKEPFFFMAEAGDGMNPEFFREVRRRMELLEPSDAGLLVVPVREDGGRVPAEANLPPRAPSLWRTEAVLSGPLPGFAERELLPFDSYTLLEKKLQLDSEWSWHTFRTASYRPALQRRLGWKRAEQEWRYLAPLLAAERSASPAEPSPLFTIAICTYNDAEYLPWAVRSVLVQSMPEWELIVIDDGSNDSAEAVITRCLPVRDRRVRILRNDSNRGKSASLNRAFAAAKGRWLLELDADDWLDPCCLVTLARHAAAAGSDTGALCASHVEWQERANRQLVPGVVRTLAEEPTAESLLQHPYAIAPRAYSTAALREIGGWWTHDPYEGRLYEDLQMMIRLVPNRSVVRIPAPLYHRRVRQGSVTQRSKACYQAWRAWMEAQIPPGS